jgi:CheY-like chemotaxis protein
LVDDSEFHLSNFKEYLEMEGFTVTTAVNGKDALALLKKENFDLLVTDNNMPFIKGIELLEKIKSLKIKKYLHTSEFSQELADQAKKLGATCMAKDIENLEEFIKNTF